MIHFAVRIAESGETISRLGVSRGVFKYLKGNGVDDRNAIAMALHAGRDVLDYDIAPEGTRGLGRAIPFLRAGITGWDAANRSLIGRPVGAIMQAARRGGYANLDAEQKLVLQSAWKQWLTMGAYAYSFIKVIG